MTHRSGNRRGYSMVMVVLFLVLILGMWGQAGRRIASLMRIEQARARRVLKDAAQAPAAAALARALATLEQGFSPSPSYTCAIQAPDGSLFAATFASVPESPNQWVVSVSSTSDTTLPPLDAANFGVAPPTPSR